MIKSKNSAFYLRYNKKYKPIFFNNLCLEHLFILRKISYFTKNNLSHLIIILKLFIKFLKKNLIKKK